MSSSPSDETRPEPRRPADPPSGPDELEQRQRVDGEDEPDMFVDVPDEPLSPDVIEQHMLVEDDDRDAYP